jgi:hypothetical protein
MHVLGLLLIIGAAAMLINPSTEPQTVAAMVWVSSALGLGLLMISPYPVIKAIQWMQRTNDKS